MRVPRIGISLGDPGGVGPEIILKALESVARPAEAAFVVFGDARVLEAEAARQGLRPEWRRRPDAAAPPAPGLYLRDMPTGLKSLASGSATKENGEASFLFFEAAVEEARRGALDALVTGPVSKSAWDMAGHKWRGHTEYLERFYPEAMMTFWSDRLRVALLSHHLPLREALERVRKDVLTGFLRNLHRALERAKPEEYSLLVAGLNPHAGEDGLMGSEEIREIGPAVEAARAEGIRVDGPFPPDTVYHKALGRADIVVVALTHDQGLIAFKTVSFESGVNATLGMPFIRTSPDHGTAFDIAGRGVADATSMKAAVALALDFARPGAAGSTPR
jgi:4-hydroxythreonine-4-phosphate dehydrogenase